MTSSFQRSVVVLVVLPLVLRAAASVAFAQPPTPASTVTVDVKTSAPADASTGKSKPKLTPADMAKPRVASPLSPRFLQVRTRIDALLAARSGPPPTPDPRLNPFRGMSVVGTAGDPLAAGTPLGPITATSEEPTASEGVVEPVESTSGLALLQQAVGQVKIKGTVRMGNRMRVSLSTGPGKDSIYGEGDVVNVTINGEGIPLRIRTVARNSVTFTLGDAEMELKF